MAFDFGLEIAPDGFASLRPLNGLPVRRNDVDNFSHRKARLVSLELQEAAKAGVSQSQIASLRQRTLNVPAPATMTGWSDRTSAEHRKHLHGVREAHDKLDKVYQEVFEASVNAFSKKARIETTQLSLYAPRRQEIEFFRKQVLSIESSRNRTPRFGINEAAHEMKHEAADAARDNATYWWKVVKVKLQAAMVVLQSQADQRKREGRKSVRFSDVTDVREFETEADTVDADFEDLGFIADFGIGLQDEDNGFGSKLFTSDAQEHLEASTSIRPPIEKLMWGQNLNHSQDDEGVILLTSPHSWTSSVVDSGELVAQNGSLGGPAYPTPPPSSPLQPTPIKQAPLRLILVRKSYIDASPDGEPAAKRRKVVPSSLTRPVTPPGQEITLQPPRRPVKKPSIELDYGDDPTIANVRMNRITKSAKTRRNDKAAEASDEIAAGWESNGRRMSFNDSGFFDESMMSESED